MTTVELWNPDVPCARYVPTSADHPAHLRFGGDGVYLRTTDLHVAIALRDQLNTAVAQWEQKPAAAERYEQLHGLVAALLEPYPDDHPLHVLGEQLHRVIDGRGDL